MRLIFATLLASTLVECKAAPAPPVKSRAVSCPTDMAQLPAGTFIMGDRGDAVTVEPFCMDITELTVTAYMTCVSVNACTEPSPYKPDAPNKWGRASNWKRPGAGLHPVNSVDWNQASSYCVWAGKRLPSEEEWEWAARGASQGRVYPWGNDVTTADRVNACGTECVAWVKSNIGLDLGAIYAADDGWPTTAPVGSFPQGATAQGLQDMAGNVAEWTSSRYTANTRVIRGGGWNSGDASVVRAADRQRDQAVYRIASLGFRCAI